MSGKAFKQARNRKRRNLIKSINKSLAEIEDDKDYEFETTKGPEKIKGSEIRAYYEHKLKGLKY